MSRSSDRIWDHQKQSRPSAASLLLQFLSINCWPNFTDPIPFNKRRKLADKTEITTSHPPSLWMNHVLQTSNTGFIKAWPKCSFGYWIAGRNNEAAQASAPFSLLCAPTSTIPSLNSYWKPRLLLVFHVHKTTVCSWMWPSRGGLLAQPHKLR